MYPKNEKSAKIPYIRDKHNKETMIKKIVFALILSMSVILNSLAAQTDTLRVLAIGSEGGHDIVAYDWNYYLDFADEKMR